MDLANAARDSRRCDAIAHAPASHRICFRHRVHNHRAVAHTLDLSHRNMFDFCAFTLIENVFVNLIGEAERIKLLTETGDEQHLLASENFARWISGITDDY